MLMTKKTLETLGGIGSIFVGVMCSGIGLVDYFDEQAWKIWVVMTVVLVVNGIAMIRHAKKRVEGDETTRPLTERARVRT